LKLYGPHKITASATVAAFGLSMMLIPISMMALGSMGSRNRGVPFILGTVLFAISFVYFSGTVNFALMEKVYRYEELVQRLGITYLVHGFILVVGVLIFPKGTISLLPFEHSKTANTK
jgi:hypothetical protein